jgi:hypothetical protein
VKGAPTAGAIANATAHATADGLLDAGAVHADLAPPAAAAPPLPAPSRSDTKWVALKDLVTRAAPELDSPIRRKKLPAQTVVRVLRTHHLPDGTRRALVMLEEQAHNRKGRHEGWVSFRADLLAPCVEEEAGVEEKDPPSQRLGEATRTAAPAPAPAASAAGPSSAPFAAPAAPSAAPFSSSSSSCSSSALVDLSDEQGSRLEPAPLVAVAAAAGITTKAEYAAVLALHSAQVRGAKRNPSLWP